MVSVYGGAGLVTNARRNGSLPTPNPHRFVLVFDRKGWSPAFFAEWWRTHRIAVQTYQRGTYEPWPVEFFTVHEPLP